MSIMAVHGRGGDIVMSMSAAELIRKSTGESPSIAVFEDYVPIAELMVKIGMPVSSVVSSSFLCKHMDTRVFGSSVSRWSPSLFAYTYGQFDNYNCCLGSVPQGIHLCSYMRYLTGLDKSLSEFPSAPPVSPDYAHIGGASCIVYHFGGSSPSQLIDMDSDPFPGLISIFTGTDRDPIPSWADIDLRGSSLVSLCRILRISAACVGSDSLVTHISSLLGVPTVALHTVPRSMPMSDRKYASRGHSVLYNEGKKVIDEVIDLLSRYVS